MSIEYTYAVMPATAFAEGKPEQHARPEDGQRFTIFLAADYPLHQVFTQLGGVLRFVIAGDYCPEGSYDDPTGPDPVYSAWVTPASVKEIAKALTKLPRWKMIDLLRKYDRNLVQHKEGRDQYSDAYDAVQAAYATAAKQGAGLRILMC